MFSDEKTAATVMANADHAPGDNACSADRGMRSDLDTFAGAPKTKILSVCLIRRRAPDCKFRLRYCKIVRSIIYLSTHRLDILH